MNDTAWCRTVLDRLDERLLGWTHLAGRFSRELDEMEVAWNDNSAREVFDRYLRPHREDVEATLTFLRQQRDLLRGVVVQMTAADAPAAESQLLSMEAVGLRQQGDNEAASAHRHADAALNDAAAARLRASQVRDILAGIR